MALPCHLFSVVPCQHLRSAPQADIGLIGRSKGSPKEKCCWYPGRCLRGDRRGWLATNHAPFAKLPGQLSERPFKWREGSCPGADCSTKHQTLLQHAARPANGGTRSIVLTRQALARVRACGYRLTSCRCPRGRSRTGRELQPNYILFTTQAEVSTCYPEVMRVHESVSEWVG